MRKFKVIEKCLIQFLKQILHFLKKPNIAETYLNYLKNQL